MKKVLITGVAGMIGSHLLDYLLERDYEVIGIDNLTYGTLENIRYHTGDARFRFYRVDVEDFETLKILSRDVDTIFHLAAVKKISEAESSMATLKVNVEGTENIFEAARMWGCKVVFASTSDVYGMSPDLPFREDGDLLLGPSMIKRWSYAVAKLFSEQMAYAYYKDYAVPIVVLRYFGGFSPRSSFSWSGGHVPIFVDAILNDREVTIHGDGTQSRSMAYVDDLIEGTFLASVNDKAVGEVINLGNDEEMSVIDTACLIHRIADTGLPLKLRHIGMEEVFGQYKDIMRRCPDLTKARTLLGYSPKTDMAEAIRKVIEHRRQTLEQAA
ncbi:nucleoside-diphosphate sugar epimerase [Desulfonema ishimotonii]|uniref:UDP-glucuronate decarboxylase n=1 Tax=Desulfonema ishimotonii TaxID=45657 RepID=A0A401FVF7_9BACT|nr:GDP-mannose 4,6-dehydratase [Desulfonema ishimotonii]GBC60938.1 nucleoside-diphosphate sugar epimerase [Desulfonema ishimotonii]